MGSTMAVTAGHIRYGVRDDKFETSCTDNKCWREIVGEFGWCDGDCGTGRCLCSLHVDMAQEGEIILCV